MQRCCPPPPPQNSNNLHPLLRRVRNGIPAGLAVCILTLAGILAAPEAQAQQNCITGASVVDGVCTCPAGEVPLVGECGKCTSEQISFNGDCIADTLPSEAEAYANRLKAVADIFEAGVPDEARALRAMRAAVLAKHAGDPNFYDLVSAHDTGGASFAYSYYFNMINHANTYYGANKFNADNDNELARILTFVPAIPPASEKCRSAGWTYSADGSGSCGVPLTLSGGAVSNQCHLSGSDSPQSPQCDAVFGSTVNYFPALTLSANGATLRFVYNCDPDGSKNEIPATSNTIGATECTCAAKHELMDGACVEICTETETKIDGVCVANSVLDKCESAGWSFSAADGSCGILLTLSGGDPADKCYFAGESPPQCADVFGSTLHYFPSPTLSAENATLRFVYNCDPDDENGLLPATANTIAATECVCAAGAESVGGVCVPTEIAAGARNCLEAERVLSAESGGSCAVAITLSGGTLYSRCHFSGESEPKCDAVFGAEVMFPSVAVAGPFIYNCDPDDENGLIPALSNTVEATECACPAGGQSVTDGMCACPSGQGVLSDSGICGVCPVGQDVIGGFCLPGVIMGQCVTVGWRFSAADGGSCGVLLTVAGEESVDRCYVSGVLEPQCEEVFGGTVNYFPAPTLAADGATLRFVYDCDPEGDRGGMVPAAANTIMATECGCASETSHLRPGACVPDEDASPDFDGIAQKALCGAFGGTVRTATGGREVCSGMDANDTFCIMDSAAGFPCRGLFKHLRSCNVEFNRKALNPFFCGENCGVQKAVGSECR